MLEGAEWGTGMAHKQGTSHRCRGSWGMGATGDSHPMIQLTTALGEFRLCTQIFFKTVYKLEFLCDTWPIFRSLLQTSSLLFYWSMTYIDKRAQLICVQVKELWEMNVSVQPPSRSKRKTKTQNMTRLLEIWALLPNFHLFLPSHRCLKFVWLV